MLSSKPNLKFLFILLPLFLHACYHEAELNEVTQSPSPVYQNTDTRLWTYFSSFENEANARGFHIDINALGIVSSIDGIDDDGVAGYCSYINNDPHRIVIDSDFWSSANSTIREMVVFHELGHCVLLRGHSEESVNGVCQSIMASGLGSCNVIYNQNNRSNYLNELFFGS